MAERIAGKRPKGGHNSAILGEKPDRKSGPTKRLGAREARAAQAGKAGHLGRRANGNATAGSSRREGTTSGRHGRRGGAARRAAATAAAMIKSAAGKRLNRASPRSAPYSGLAARLPYLASIAALLETEAKPAAEASSQPASYGL
jgi:hypothetical protein